MCCFAYSVDQVPSVRGQADSPLIHKPTNTPCPQLAFDANGKAVCLVHDAKTSNPALWVCASWQGNIRDRIVGTMFEDLESLVLENILWPKSQSDVAIYEQAAATGRISDNTLSCAREFLGTGYTTLLPEKSPRGFHPLVDFICLYCREYEVLPDTLFTRLNIGTLLEFLWPTIESQFKALGMHPHQEQTPLLRSFWARYHRYIPTTEPCPSPSIPVSSAPTTSAVKP